MTMTNWTWSGQATALSSVSHGGETRGLVTLLRRETILTPEGPLSIPLISGNALRGKLRRTAESITAEALNYRGKLTISAAAALRSGGSLVKTGKDPISGTTLARLRELVPLIGVFGTAGAGRIIDGCLQVGKMVPHSHETAHLTHATTSTRWSISELTQVETYARSDDSHRHDAIATLPTDSPPENTQTQWRIETFRAGTTFDLWLNLTSPTPVEASFFASVLEAYSSQAIIAGRAATGHGRLHLDLTCTQDTTTLPDWRPNPDTIDEAIGLLNLL